jgi:tRNA uridine 5-carbamoylmethylation protein Kti12
MIIIEGVDNSGKTTLCNKLSEAFDLNIWIREGPVKDKRILVDRIRESFLKHDDDILDRHPIISEMVYGAVIRHNNLLGDWEFNYLALLVKQNPLIIYCRPPNRKIIKFGRRKQMKGVKERIYRLMDRYDWVFGVIMESSLPSNLIEYDYTRHSDEWLFNKVDKYLIRRYSHDT